MSALSNTYTTKQFFDNATREIKEFSENDVVYNERYLLTDRASELTQGLVADVVAESYMQDGTPALSTGKYGSSAMSYVASTKVLTATMSTAFASTDVGKFVVFRTGETTYGGTILTFTSTTVVVLTGMSLPSTDIATVDDLIVLATPPSGDVIDISTVRMLRHGTQERVKLFSTATTTIEKVNDYDYDKFPTTAIYNKNKIIWNLTGASIYLKKGSSLASYGTFTLRYPRLPLPVTADSDKVDLLDGSMVQLGIGVLKTLIERRLGIPETGKEELALLVQAVYREFTGEMKLTKEQAMSRLVGMV